MEHLHYEPSVNTTSVYIQDVSRVSPSTKIFSLANLDSDALNLLCGHYAISREENSQRHITIYISAAHHHDKKSELEAFHTQVYPQLRLYCAENNFDVDLVDMRSWLNASDNTDLVNKYMHQMLIYALWYRVLNNGDKCLFVIYMRDSFDEPLCPHEVDPAEFESLRSRLTADATALVDKFYQKSKSGIYKFAYSVLIENSGERRAQLNADLAALSQIFERDENASRLLRSLQQIEIEKALDKLLSKDIIWYHCAEKAAPNGSKQHENVLNQLKRMVLADNFKMNNECGDLVEFMYKCCYGIVSEFVREHHTLRIPLRIDKGLARELCQQAAVYAELCQSPRSTADEIETVHRRLKCSSSRYPFVIFEQMDTSNGGLDFDILSRHSAALIKAQIESTKASCGSTEASNAVVYRFCAKTSASFTLKSLLQSVMHQLCYLFEVHESYAFQVSFFKLKKLNFYKFWLLKDFSSMLDNLTKLFEFIESERIAKLKQFDGIDLSQTTVSLPATKLCGQQAASKTLYLVLDRIDKLDFPNENVLIDFLRTMFSLSDICSEQLKLIITFSTSNINDSKLFKCVEVSQR